MANHVKIICEQFSSSVSIHTMHVLKARQEYELIADNLNRARSLEGSRTSLCSYALVKKSLLNSLIIMGAWDRIPLTTNRKIKSFFLSIKGIFTLCSSHGRNFSKPAVACQIKNSSKSLVTVVHSKSRWFIKPSTNQWE